MKNKPLFYAGEGIIYFDFEKDGVAWGFIGQSDGTRNTSLPVHSLLAHFNGYYREIDENDTSVPYFSERS